MAPTQEFIETGTRGEVLSRFFELSLDMLCIAGFDGYFKQINGAWEEVTGFTAEELTSRPFIEFVHPDDVQRTQDEVARLLERGYRTLRFENRYRCKNGDYKWFQWTSQPDHRRQLMYAVARDVTWERRARDLLALQAAQLEALARRHADERRDGAASRLA